MSDAPRVDDMSGRTSVNCLPIGRAEQQTKEQHNSAVEDKVFGGSDHRGEICKVYGGAKRRTSFMRPLERQLIPASAQNTRETIKPSMRPHNT